MQAYIEYLVDWLEQQREAYQAEGYVIGISGGIDSAVVVNLLMQTKAKVQGIVLPSATTSQQDIDNAYLVANQANCPLIEVSIKDTYSEFFNAIQPLLNPNADRQNVIAGNVQARLRMSMLYAYAQSNQAIVVGTDNAAEWYTGYFTKFGDGGVDVAPLLHLRKEQVYQMAKLLAVPQNIIDKAPSAGLWVGQTDEAELGVTYQELDAFLRGEQVSQQAQERIAFWHDRSWHKRQLANTPNPPTI